MSRMARVITLLMLGLVVTACIAENLVTAETQPNQSTQPAQAILSPPVMEVPTTDSPTIQPTASLSPKQDGQPLRLSQLTYDGCCNGPFWLPDSQKVLYLDKPNSDAPAGIWGIDRKGGTPEFITDRLGGYSADFSLRAFPSDGKTLVERLADGSRWIIPNGGRAVSFSPDGLKLAWTTGRSSPPLDNAMRQIWISAYDGNHARQIHELLAGGVVGWFPDGRLLVSGRLTQPRSEQAYWVLTPPSDENEPLQIQELARAQRLRGAALSSDGTWLVYGVTFSEDPTQDGLRLVNTLSLERRKLELFGSYRWRDDHRLLIVPLDLSQTDSHRLWQIDALTGQAEPLTNPDLTSFKIANGDWSVSPDGNSIAFVSATDQNIWLIHLDQP